MFKKKKKKPTSTGKSFLLRQRFSSLLAEGIFPIAPFKITITLSWHLHLAFLALREATVSRILMQVDLNNAVVPVALRCTGGDYREPWDGISVNMIGGMRRRYKVTSNVTLLKNLAKLPLITVNIDINYRLFPFSSVCGNGKGWKALFPFTCVSALSPWTCTTQSTPRKTECRFHTGASKTAWMCTTLNSCCKLPKVSHRNSKIATTGSLQFRI